MNKILPSRYDEDIRQGALAIELWDALRGDRMAQPVEVTVDGGGLAPIAKHTLNMHGLFFSKALKSPITLRFEDRSRAYVARRVQYPIIAAVTPPGAEPNAGFRIRRTFLYPGATYAYSSGASGVRGTLRYAAGGAPVRWARVEAYLDDVLVGRAHGDDRGEFLLILEQAASGDGPLPSELTVDLQFYAAAAAPPPSDYAIDRLHDLPIDVVADAVVDDTDPLQVTYLPKPDPVALGETPPPSLHTFTPRTTVTVALGRVESRVISI